MTYNPGLARSAQITDYSVLTRALKHPNLPSMDPFHSAADGSGQTYGWKWEDPNNKNSYELHAHADENGSIQETEEFTLEEIGRHQKTKIALPRKWLKGVEIDGEDLLTKIKSLISKKRREQRRAHTATSHLRTGSQHHAMTSTQRTGMAQHTAGQPTGTETSFLNRAGTGTGTGSSQHASSKTTRTGASQTGTGILNRAAPRSANRARRTAIPEGDAQRGQRLLLDYGIDLGHKLKYDPALINTLRDKGMKINQNKHVRAYILSDTNKNKQESSSHVMDSDIYNKYDNIDGLLYEQNYYPDASGYEPQYFHSANLIPHRYSNVNHEVYGFTLMLIPMIMIIIAVFCLICVAINAFIGAICYKYWKMQNKNATYLDQISIVSPV